MTAIIDWELSHIGDPMVDLGAMRLRECLYPAGMFPFVLERYRELGMPVDDQAIRYYTVVTILFTLFGTIGGTVRLDPRNDEVILQLWCSTPPSCALRGDRQFEDIGSCSLTRGRRRGDDVRLHELLADRIYQLAQRNREWAGELRSSPRSPTPSSAISGTAPVQRRRTSRISRRASLRHRSTSPTASGARPGHRSRTGRRLRATVQTLYRLRCVTSGPGSR